ncbi:MAG: ATP synthase subunit I [Spirochaetales bacterium]
MEAQVRLLVISHAVVLVLAAVGGFVWAGLPGSLSVGSGLLSFSVPVVIFSTLVLQATSADPGRFWGRFMVAEVLKWTLSGVLLALAFASGWFQPLPLMAGFFVSVVVQMVYPILAKRGSES